MSFRGEALEGIRVIAERYDAIDPDLTQRIRGDLQRSFRLLIFPKLEPSSQRRRRNKTLSYKHLYRVHHRDERRIAPSDHREPGGSEAGAQRQRPPRPVCDHAQTPRNPLRSAKSQIPGNRDFVPA